MLKCDRNNVMHIRIRRHIPEMKRSIDKQSLLSSAGSYDQRIAPIRQDTFNPVTKFSSFIINN